MFISQVSRGTCALIAAAALAAWSITMPALSHDDEDGGHNPGPPYEGPGYDDGDEGGPPVEFEHHGLTLRSWIPPQAIGEGSTHGNDCWGYVSPTGREYAIIGTSSGTGFIEITNPGLPEIVEFIPGPESLWRDMKTYQHFAYMVSEGGGGIQVVDLSGIDDGKVVLVNSVIGPGTAQTHNVAIDEYSGYLYRCGGGSGTIGLRIYDLSDPVNPTFVGAWHERYIHDAQIVTYTEGPYTGRQIAFAFSNNNSGGGNPGVDILDVTDKSDIIELSLATYSFPAYSHQGWLSPDRQYLYVGDELAEVQYGIPSTTNVIDVSDLENPFEVNCFTNGVNAITHNMYTLDNYLFQANYRSGLRVFDATDPVHPVEVALFDTHPQNDGNGFDGLWGNFPYFPSGTIIGSDLQKGLFVWQLDLAIPGDINGDGIVDVQDLLILLASWGPCADPDDCSADLDDNGAVDVFDLLILLRHWSL